MRIRGHIDETFQVDELASGTNNVLVIDLAGVQRVTSFGIREWISALQKLRADYYCFINCTPSIVSQLNLVSGFAGKGEVVSFEAPYLCPNCDTAATKLLDLRRSDHQQVVATFEPPRLECPECGEPSEFDDLPELYLQYFRTAPLPNPPALAALIIDGRDTGQTFNLEKHIADTVTAVWMSGAMHRAPYFKHLAEGLQGDVVIVARDVDGVADDGLRGFTRFLRAPELTSYLARVPALLVVSLAEYAAAHHDGDLGAANLISVMLPAHCHECHRDIAVEVGKDAVEELLARAEDLVAVAAGGQTSGAGDPHERIIDIYCPHCAHAARPAVSAEWLHAMAQLPMALAPESIAQYLADRPDGPSPVSETESGSTSAAGSDGNPLTSRYKIIRRLGSGGMGDVFLGRRIGPAGFQKLVVIKRIRTDRVADGDVVDSFLEEARLSARLSHPNIVQIFDLGTVEDEYFLSMEYVDGLDLRTIFQINDKLSLDTPIGICCRIISDLCQALHAAHIHKDESGEARPIIHRDVSPGNVLISIDGIAKLTDFGIAKAGDSQNETKSGIIKGTMRYIPPEVLRGPKAKTLHPRIDVYGAGILLYECLTGRALFSGDGWVHTLRAILRQSIPKLSEQRPGVSPALERAFEKAIARDPRKRYQEIQEFQRDLEAAVVEMGAVVTNSQLGAWVRDLIERKKALEPDDTKDVVVATTEGENDLSNQSQGG